MKAGSPASLDPAPEGRTRHVTASCLRRRRLGLWRPSSDAPIPRGTAAPAAGLSWLQAPDPPRSGRAVRCLGMPQKSDRWIGPLPEHLASHGAARGDGDTGPSTRAPSPPPKPADPVRRRASRWGRRVAADKHRVGILSMFFVRHPGRHRWRTRVAIPAGGQPDGGPYRGGSDRFVSCD